MKIIRLSEENNPNSQTVAKIYSLQDFIHSMPDIKQQGWNVISLRDTPQGSSPDYQALYKRIDGQGFHNIYVATFDDLEIDDVNVIAAKPYMVIPSMSAIQSILDWAKHKWEENRKPFAVHCTGGISRSSAIAVLIGKMLTNSYAGIFNPQYHSPNNTILDYGGHYLGDENLRDELTEKVKTWDKEHPFGFEKI